METEVYLDHGSTVIYENWYKKSYEQKNEFGILVSSDLQLLAWASLGAASRGQL